MLFVYSKIKLGSLIGEFISCERRPDLGKLESSDGTIPKFTSIPIPIKCSISIPILDSNYNISCGG